jgi:hypothetical protein
MQIKQFQGLWFLFDSKDNKIYAYEKDPKQPLWLGSVTTEGVVQLRSDWKTVYAPKLEEYRTTEKPKSRVPTTAA